MIADPWVVGAALQRVVERHLHAELLRPPDERLEVVEPTELRMNLGVAALGAADRPGAAGIVGTRLE